MYKKRKEEKELYGKERSGGYGEGGEEEVRGGRVSVEKRRRKGHRLDIIRVLNEP